MPRGRLLMCESEEKLSSKGKSAQRLASSERSATYDCNRCSRFLGRTYSSESPRDVGNDNSNFFDTSASAYFSAHMPEEKAFF
jgi:hypothetical protein